MASRIRFSQSNRSRQQISCTAGRAVVIDVREKRKHRRPVVPRTRIKRVLDAHIGSLDLLAEQLGWTASKLSKLRHGRQAPTLADLVELARALEIPVTELLDETSIGVNHLPVEKVPLVELGLLACLNAAGVAALRASWGGPTLLLPASVPNAFAITYQAGDMDRSLRPGSQVLIDPDQTTPEHGCVYLIESDGAMLLREHRADGGAPRWISQSMRPIDDLFARDHPHLRVVGRAIKALINF